MTSYSRQTRLADGVILVEHEDPLRVELRHTYSDGLALRTLEIPGFAWYALKQHLRDTDPRLTALLAKSADTDPLVDELRATIVRQANEITALKEAAG